MNGFDSLKYFQHFDLHNFNEKKRKKQKKKIIQFETFQNTSSIIKHCEI